MGEIPLYKSRVTQVLERAGRLLLNSRIGARVPCAGITGEKIGSSRRPGVNNAWIGWRQARCAWGIPHKIHQETVAIASRRWHQRDPVSAMHLQIRHRIVLHLENEVALSNPRSEEHTSELQSLRH